MAKYIEGISRKQITLFPECIDDFISEDNEVRIIDYFVDSLDLVELGFKNASIEPSKKGAPSYDPRVILKMYLYSYPKKIRSSRKIATEAGRNIELMWLTGRLQPDFRTISDFRKDNSKALKKVLVQFNQMCIDLDLFSDELKSLDGSKFAAVNSKDNNFTMDKLVDRIKRIEANISDFLDELNSNDSSEQTEKNVSIKEKIEMLEQRKNTYNKYLDDLMDNHDTQISVTDKDSKLMKCNGKMLVGYNAQFLTDTKSHIVNDFVITNSPCDNGQIFSSTSNFIDNDSYVEVLADAGYKSEDDLKTCFENKIVSILPDGVYTTTFDYVEADITEDIKKGETASDVQTCLHAGVIPECYSHLNLELTIETNSSYSFPESNLSDEERLNKATQGYFVRSSHNSVFCPQGHELSFIKSDKYDDIFSGASFCKNCPNKCTINACKKLTMSKRNFIQGTPKYHTQTPKPECTKTENKIIRLTYIPDKDKYKLRKNTSEHPFGTLKRTHDASYFLTKGVDKVTGEMALSVLGYNFTRLLKLVDIKTLIEYFKKKPIYA